MPSKGVVPPDGIRQIVAIVLLLFKTKKIPSLQGQVRSQENKFAGAIWDCLPVTEKEKDSIVFAALCPEVTLYTLNNPNP